ncbi:MAG: endonuclease/exonuclease/phosphatase family protein [Bacteroidota bacterium]
MKKIFRQILFYLNFLLAFGLLLAYMSVFVNPSVFVIPAFFGLAYPYLLILNVIFLFYWIIRLKKEFLLPLVVILLGWNHLTSLLPMRFAQEKTREAEAPFIKVLTYNVRSLNVFNWANNKNARNEIFSLIRAEDPDVFGLQEFYTTPARGKRLRDVIREFPATPYHSVYFSIDGKDGEGFGIATFSRYPIIKTSRIPFDHTMNLAVYSDIKVGDDTLRVINVHLQSIRFREKNYAFMDTLKLKYNNQQMAELKDIGLRLRDGFAMRAEQSRIISNYVKLSPYPVIVIGDFNDTPVSYTYHRVIRGLKDSFRESGKGFGNTYAGELPSFRIDYILHSPELASKDYKRIRKKYSDHFPVTAVIGKARAREKKP